MHFGDTTCFQGESVLNLSDISPYSGVFHFSQLLADSPLNLAGISNRTLKN